MSTAQSDAAGGPAPSRPWTAAETAEDLLAQVEDALFAGWSQDEIIGALELEGLEGPTAAALAGDVQRDAEAAGGPSSSGEHQRLFMSLGRARQHLRRDDDALTIDEQRREALTLALQKAGLRESTAQAVVSDLVGLERRVALVYQRRMRRLGLQGMAVGGGATALFLFGGLFGGGGARWHLVSAAMTGAFFIYATLLYRRGRPPRR